MSCRVCSSCCVFLLVAWASVCGGLVQAADAPRVKVYRLGQTEELPGVRYARAALAITLPARTTNHILVARSDRLGGYVKIGETVIGAGKLTRDQILAKVAAVEAEDDALVAQQRAKVYNDLADAKFTLVDLANQQGGIALAGGSGGMSASTVDAARNLLAANSGAYPTQVSMSGGGCVGFT